MKYKLILLFLIPFFIASSNVEIKTLKEAIREVKHLNNEFTVQIEIFKNLLEIAKTLEALGNGKNLAAIGEQQQNYFEEWFHLEYLRKLTPQLDDEHLTLRQRILANAVMLLMKHIDELLKLCEKRIWSGDHDQPVFSMLQCNRGQLNGLGRWRGRMVEAIEQGPFFILFPPFSKHYVKTIIQELDALIQAKIKVKKENISEAHWSEGIQKFAKNLFSSLNPFHWNKENHEAESSQETDSVSLQAEGRREFQRMAKELMVEFDQSDYWQPARKEALLKARLNFEKIFVKANLIKQIFLFSIGLFTKVEPNMFHDEPVEKFNEDATNLVKEVTKYLKMAEDAKEITFLLYSSKLIVGPKGENSHNNLIGNDKIDDQSTDHSKILDIYRENLMANWNLLEDVNWQGLAKGNLEVFKTLDGRQFLPDDHWMVLEMELCRSIGILQDTIHFIQNRKIKTVEEEKRSSKTNEEVAAKNI